MAGTVMRFTHCFGIPFTIDSLKIKIKLFLDLFLLLCRRIIFDRNIQLSVVF